MVMEMTRADVSATVDRAELLAALRYVAPAAPRGARAPLLAGVVVDVDEFGARLWVTDCHQWRGYRVSTEPGARFGRFAVDARELLNLMRRWSTGGRRANPSCPVTVEVGAQCATFSDGRRSATLALLDVDGIPAAPRVDDEVGMVVGDVAALAGAVGAVARFAGDDDTVPLLQVVRVRHVDAHLELSATDRYRLAEATLTHPYRPASDALTEALVPAAPLAAAAAAAAAVAEVSDQAYIHADGRHWSMSTHRVVLTVDKELGSYPPVHRLWPDPGADDYSVEVDAATLAAAVKRTAPNRRAVVDVTFDGASALVQCVEDGAVVAAETVACHRFDDRGPVTVRFDARFLAEVLAVKHGRPDVRIRFADPVKPVTFTAPGSPRRVLLMPLRVAR